MSELSERPAVRVTGARPKDLVFTLFGEYLLDRQEPVWVGSLIGLLHPFDVSEGAVRTALSRMTRKGWLAGQRDGRHAHYRLTERGRLLLEEGQARIYHSTWDRPWDGAWLLLAYSIPENSRHLRDRLRDRLAWLGFGSLGNGLWISPHDVSVEVRSVTGRLGIAEHVECFRSTRVSEEPVEALVAKCWDVPALNRKYETFVGRWTAEAAALRERARRGRLEPQACFTARFALIHEYRGFPLEDPYLPRQLLPERWHGEAATELFHRIHDELVGPADEYVDSVLATAPV